MSYKTFLHVGRETVKGDALHQLSDAAAGHYDVGYLRLAADVADRETITIGEDSFELVSYATDSTEVTSAFDNTNAEVTETATAHGFAVGDILRIENEFVLVTAVGSANTFTASRGYAGSTIASHADATAIYKKGATALTAGKITLPIGATLTPAAAGPQIATGIQALNNAGFSAEYDTNWVAVFRPSKDGTVAVSETLGGTNNAWDAATIGGGVSRGATKWAVAKLAAAAADVTRGYLKFKFPFAPTWARVSVQTAAGVAKAWDGAYAISSSTVKVDNSGTTDWAATDVVVVEVSGN